MKKYFYLLAFCSAALLTAQSPVLSTYNAATGWKNTATTPQASEERQVGTFKAIGVSGPFEVTLTNGTPGAIRLEGSSNVRDKIETKVKEGELIIKFKNYKIASRMNSKIRIEVPIQTISSVKLSGSGRIISDFKIKTNTMHTALSGSGKIAISVTAENLKGKLSGSGKIELKGAAENTSLQLSGSGRITASALESQEAEVKISGSGRIEVYAQEMLSSQISGSGTVKYKSDNEKPRVFSTVNGSGRVTRGM